MVTLQLNQHPLSLLDLENLRFVAWCGVFPVLRKDALQRHRSHYHLITSTSDTGIIVHQAVNLHRRAGPSDI